MPDRPTQALNTSFALDRPSPSDTFATDRVVGNPTATSAVPHKFTDWELVGRALDVASSHVLIVDVTLPHFPIAYANRAAEMDHGYDRGQLFGVGLFTILPDQINRGPLRRLRHAIAGSDGIRVELQSARSDGTLFWVGLSLSPIVTDNGSVHHYLVMGSDISQRLDAERKKKELQQMLESEMHERQRLEAELQLAQKLESVGRLAAGIAHEINTPIQYIGDSVHFIRQAVDDLEGLMATQSALLTRAAQGEPAGELLHEQAQYEAQIDLPFVREEIPRAFERTLDGVERVTAIVRAMKEFAHPDQENQLLSDLNHAIESTLTVAHNEYKYVARATTDFGELPQVMCNIGQLNQVFLNIIVNASHAITDAGRSPEDGEIKITTRHEDGWVSVSIADNGCGIPEDIRHKIFDPFFTTKEVGRGSGQGLTLTRAIVVDKHGGTVDVKSSVGAGTEFILRLPVEGKQARV